MSEPVQLNLNKEDLEAKIKEMTAFLKKGSGLLTDEEDITYFSTHKKWLMAGRALADTNEKLALILLQYVSLVNKLFFLLIRRDIKWESLLEEYRKLDSIELIQSWTEAYAAERKKKQDEVKVLVDELREDENKLDIFKAVCNGMSEEDAKKQLAQYEEQMQKAMTGGIQQ